MDNTFLEGGIENLEKVKEKLQEESGKQEAFNAAEAELKAKQKDLENQKKYMTDKIATATKERRAELKKQHDEQVDAVAKELKEAEKRRKDAKASAVSERMKNETADLVAQNEGFKKANAELFRANKVPAFCNTEFYYSLFAPKTGKNFIFFIITVIVTLGLIPNIICLLIKSDQLILKILVYMAIVIFFAAIYFVIFATTRGKGRGAAIEQGRLNMDQIEKNNKEIKKIQHGIKTDKDESLYGLEEYDAQISEFQSSLESKITERDEALKVFDEETSLSIKDEIEKENIPVIEQLEAELSEMENGLNEQKAEVVSLGEEISNSYGVFLGKKNMSEERIDKMIGLMQEGKAETIMQALDQINGEIK